MILMFYIFTKFHENILDGISYRVDTVFIKKIQRGVIP